ncbi:hypothetical protein B0H10DRAFT_2027125 [Mycena sp. CBHHK59/15]|nr:hypothetical protein B0H10DRAFT_2027125 [Mycena sp. CBHHK59/15]
MSKPKSSVVVLGGGGAAMHSSGFGLICFDRSLQLRIAGVPLARTLAQQLEAKVALIEARGYYLHYPGALRMLVTAEGSLEDKVLIRTTNCLRKQQGLSTMHPPRPLYPSKTSGAVKRLRRSDCGNKMEAFGFQIRICYIRVF